MSRTYVDYLKIVLCSIFILALSACEPQFNNQTGRAPSSSVQSTQTTTKDPPCDPNGSPFGGGNGTKNNPFTVCTKQHLMNIVDDSKPSNPQYASGGYYYVLVSDIDFGFYDNSNKCTNTGAKPYIIGDSSIDFRSNPSPFIGSFDGRNHKISNFCYQRTGSHTITRVGLFGYIAKAEIKNLKLENLTLFASGFVGSVFGYCEESTVQNIQVNNLSINPLVTPASQTIVFAGGIGGYAYTCNIYNSSVTNLTIHGENNTGGWRGGDWSAGAIGYLDYASRLIGFNIDSSSIYFGNSSYYGAFTGYKDPMTVVSQTSRTNTTRCINGKMNVTCPAQ